MSVPFDLTRYKSALAELECLTSIMEGLKQPEQIWCETAWEYYGYAQEAYDLMSLEQQQEVGARLERLGHRLGKLSRHWNH